MAAAWNGVLANTCPGAILIPEIVQSRGEKRAEKVVLSRVCELTTEGCKRVRGLALGSRDTFIVSSLRDHPFLHDHQLRHVPLLDSGLEPVPSSESNSELNGGEKLRNCKGYFACFATVSQRHLKILHSIIGSRRKLHKRSTSVGRN